MDKTILVSFSGGKTSGFMAKWAKDTWERDFNLIFAFANTGLEHEKTLAFANRCDREWGLNLIWLEAVVHHGEEKGSTHRIVDFASASRNGEPFEEMIKKYGIPNKKYPHCTRELKLNVMLSYMRSIGLSDDYLRAVGIRADEPQRIRKDAKEEGIIYPLATTFPMTKRDINDWWEEQPFNLELMNYQGNCVGCWKKSTTKLVRIAKETPQVFDFNLRMEREHGFYADGQPRMFFRGNTPTAALLELARNQTQMRMFFDDEDADAGCSESCEVFV